MVETPIRASHYKKQIEELGALDIRPFPTINSPILGLAQSNIDIYCRKALLASISCTKSLLGTLVTWVCLGKWRTRGWMTCSKAQKMN